MDCGGKMSAKSDKIEIVQRINAAVKSAGLPDLPFELLHKADAITLNLFYDWLTVVRGKIVERTPSVIGVNKGTVTAYCRNCNEVITFTGGFLTVGNDGMVTCSDCRG